MELLLPLRVLLPLTRLAVGSTTSVALCIASTGAAATDGGGYEEVELVGVVSPATLSFGVVVTGVIGLGLSLRSSSGRKGSFPRIVGSSWISTSCSTGAAAGAGAASAGGSGASAGELGGLS